MSCGQKPFASKQTRTKCAFERRYNDCFTLYRRPQIEACSSNTYQGLLQNGKWMIVNSKFLERSQKRCRRNQLIRRGLIKTKIDRPLQTVGCLELRRYHDRYWSLCEPYSRKNPRRTTDPAYAHTHIHARTHAVSLSRTQTYCLPVSHARLARTLARIH